jgi:hypothetical protein
MIENDTRLYDLTRDPGQETPLQEPELELRMERLMVELMTQNQAPPEAFARLDIESRSLAGERTTAAAE